MRERLLGSFKICVYLEVYRYLNRHFVEKVRKNLFDRPFRLSQTVFVLPVSNFINLYLCEFSCTVGSAGGSFGHGSYGKSPNVGSFGERNLPSFKHPSYVLMEESGFTQTMYNKYRYGRHPSISSFSFL